MQYKHDTNETPACQILTFVATRKVYTVQEPSYTTLFHVTLKPQTIKQKYLNQH
jgi:hypothetical protein